MQLQHHSPCPPDAYSASYRSVPRQSLGLGMHPICRELGDDRIPRSEEHFIRSVPFECGMRHHFVVLFPCLTAAAKREFESALVRLARSQAIEDDERRNER